MRKINYILFFICVCCILSGCRSQEEEPVNITFIHGWGSAEDDHEAMRQIYKGFEKEHPEINLTVIALPSDLDVVSKTSDLLSVGEFPDIVFTAGEGKDTIYNFMVERGYAVNLAPYLQEDADFKKNISPSILDYWTAKDGALYTVSDVSLMSGYWYNRTLFQKAGITEPPKTWEEFMNVCLRLCSLGTTPLLLDQDHIVYLTNAILHEQAPEELSNISNGFINLQSSGFEASLSYLKKLSKYADFVNAYSFRDTLESFNNEETAIYMNGVWGSTLIDNNVDAAYAAFPSSTGKSVSMISSGVGYILGNTGDEKRIAASVEFLKYMLSEPVGRRLLNETGQIPSNPNIEITEDIGNERLYQAISCVQSADITIEFPANIWSHDLQTRYGTAVISYLEGKLTLAQLQEALDGF